MKRFIRNKNYLLVTGLANMPIGIYRYDTGLGSAGSQTAVFYDDQGRYVVNDQAALDSFFNVFPFTRLTIGRQYYLTMDIMVDAKIEGSWEIVVMPRNIYTYLGGSRFTQGDNPTQFRINDRQRLLLLRVVKKYSGR